jgi:hypothetical protein
MVWWYHFLRAIVDGMHEQACFLTFPLHPHWDPW